MRTFSLQYIVCILCSSLFVSAYAQTDLQQQLKMSEVQIGELTQQMLTLNQQLIAEQIRLAKLNKAQKPLSAQLTKQHHALTEQIRLAYKLGQQQSLKTLLNPDDINTINRHLYYYHYLSEARVHLVNEIEHVLTVLANNMAIISQHEQSLKDLLAQKQQQQHEQSQIQKVRQHIVAELDQKTQSRQQLLAAAAANQRMLRETLSALKIPQAAPPKNPTNQLHSGLAWPIKGTMIAPYGAWINNQQLPGVIIKAPEGTPVHAIAGGKVLFASWLRGFGLLVIINHGHGYMSLYARNHALFAKVGEIIKPRAVIASIGNSGGFRKPSLYFEVRRNGTPMNPRVWCR